MSRTNAFSNIINRGCEGNPGTSSLTGTPFRRPSKSYLCASQNHLCYISQVLSLSLAHNGHSLAEKVPAGGENKNRGETLKRPSPCIKLWVSAVHKAFASTASRKNAFQSWNLLLPHQQRNAPNPAKSKGQESKTQNPCPHTPARAWILHKSTSTSET